MFAALFDMLFNRKPGPDTFAKRFLAALRAQGAGEDMDYDPDTFQLVGRNGRTINLHNLYQTYSNSDHRGRDEAIRSYVAAFMEGNNGESQAMTFEQVRPTLMPVLRHRAMLEEMRLVHRREHGPDAAFTVVFRDIADDCVELLAVDRAESVSPCCRGRIKNGASPWNKAWPSLMTTCATPPQTALWRWPQACSGAPGRTPTIPAACCCPT